MMDPNKIKESVRKRIGSPKKVSSCFFLKDGSNLHRFNPIQFRGRIEVTKFHDGTEIFKEWLPIDVGRAKWRQLLKSGSRRI